MSVPQKIDRVAYAVLTVTILIGLALRLSWIRSISGISLWGGDGPLYLNLGLRIAEQVPLRGLLDYGILTVGPLYPFYLSIFFSSVPEALILPLARMGQALLSILTTIIVFDIGRRVLNQHTGLLSALIIAIDPRFIIQSGDIYPETLFTFMLAVSVWCFVIAHPGGAQLKQRTFNWVAYSAASIAFTLTVFTRAIALPLPILFAASTLLPKPSKRLLYLALIIIGFAAAIVSSWALWIYHENGQIILISTGVEGHFWMGSRLDGQWHGIDEFEKERADLKARYNGRDAYIEDTLKTITSEPMAYIRLLFIKSTNAYLQPYSTVSFPGESLKEMSVKVLRGQMSVVDLINGPAFFPKLIIYIFHFFGLIGGVVGIYLSRRDWLKVLPLLILIVYFTFIYTLLTIIPRYLFPIMPFYMIFAAYAATRIYIRFKRA